MNMASEEQVKRYLAHWFQLGKGVFVPNCQETILPRQIFTGNRYSSEFEKCWQRILCLEIDCYLEGTEQTIQQLLSPAWEITGCARCQLPVPIAVAGVASTVCTCFDLSGWPNNELPSPRFPVDDISHLQQIRERLNKNEDIS
ncbi:hypothetical protein [Aphanothece sacrum]|uniref:PAS domain-containing protein n=1 Tax=Aphanothece sacrum FPU1 TaxID=1920663 RepID=A0A401IH23_APHSA|nr:hypothetical protein [Aphanothece sacrum]GBF80583.1 PAS domain-containing protein [Aphanothece sacrum FPU1]GBF84027.1 PAS domain-containing protein [Aphanothece sacrum FPU3]